jgi:hypothetical protein
MNFDIYAAGHSGSPLTSLSHEERCRELSCAQRLIAQISENPTDFFSLPQGAYNEEVIEDIITAGFTHILGNETQISLPDSPVIHRIPITGNDAFASFVSKLRRLPNWIVERMKKRVIEELNSDNNWY